MTVDDFLAWHEGQERHYELVDGMPVALAHGSRRHDQVVVNTLGCLVGSLDTGRYRVFSHATAIRIPAGNIRYPDLGIDCGRFIDLAMEADAPALVVEVLSESNRLFDFVGKLEEYKSVPSLNHIVLIDTDTPEIGHWQRSGGAWTYRTLTGLDAVLTVDELAIAVPLRALYAGLEFRPKPRLVMDEPDMRAG